MSYPNDLNQESRECRCTSCQVASKIECARCEDEIEAAEEENYQFIRYMEDHFETMAGIVRPEPVIPDAVMEAASRIEFASMRIRKIANEIKKEYNL